MNILNGVGSSVGGGIKRMFYHNSAFFLVIAPLRIKKVEQRVNSGKKSKTYKKDRKLAYKNIFQVWAISLP